MGPGILPETTIHRAICRCQLKPYHANRKPYVNMVQKCLCVLWTKAHLKWTVSKWKSDLWSDESKFDILVGNHGRRVLWAKEEGDLPACYQRSVQKPKGRPCVFQQDNAKPHTAAITTAWLRSRRVRVLNWPACRVLKYPSFQKYFPCVQYIQFALNGYLYM